MAIELILRNWCDVCADDGEETEGETINVPALLDGPAFDVEVCAKHARPLTEAVANLRALGRPPGQTVQPGRARPSKGTRGAATGAPDAYACPNCAGVSYRTKTGLRAHLRDRHGQSLADVGLEPAKYTCPECGNKFGHGQGLAAHVRLTHPGVTSPNARTKQSA